MTNQQFAIEAMATEIVRFNTTSGGSFHSDVHVFQRVDVMEMLVRNYAILVDLGKWMDAWL